VEMASQSSLNIPTSSSTVQVSIIDLTYDPLVPTGLFMGPPLKGLGKRTAVTYSFLVHHTDASGRGSNVIFDLGMSKNMYDYPPNTMQAIHALGGDMHVDKCVDQVLKEHGVALDTINAVIWSHAHPDHVGKFSRFHDRTKLVVGPGIKKAFFAGWPVLLEAPVMRGEFFGRKVEELALSQFNLEIGGLKALDYFGDGSFYLLSAPGHALGHLNALARTTEDTFIYFAGDSVDQLSVLRTLSPSDLSLYVHVPSRSCPGAALHARSNYPIHHSEAPSPEKEAAARETLAAVQRFDADGRVFVVAAHDTSIHGILDLFPKTSNDWHAKDLKKKGRYLFL
ncbi:hypothetical protein BO82DRAFT_243567, partial [Aspergillus uvarum CBS 121591]